jgi:hypothetical protein
MKKVENFQKKKIYEKNGNVSKNESSTHPLQDSIGTF